MTPYEQAMCRQMAVEYACEAQRLGVAAATLSVGAQQVIVSDQVIQSGNDVADLAAVTSACAFICFVSTEPGDGGLP